MLKVSDVFVPGKLPKYTYNPRENSKIEDQLKDYLDELGAILAISGPTKTGKTVLVSRLVQNRIWIDGGLVGSIEDFYRLVVDRAGEFTTIEVAGADEYTATDETSGEANLFGAGKFAAKDVTGLNTTNSKSASVNRPASQVATDALRVSGHVLVIDDFHYIEPAVQTAIIRFLKPLVMNDVPVVLMSTFHRVGDAVRAESDMNGRLATIKIDFWSTEELMQIASLGFEKLNIIDDPEVSSILAENSFGSPQLMQTFCRELCKFNGIRTEQEHPVALTPPEQWRTFFEAAIDVEESAAWFETFLAGPKLRGKKRNVYDLVNGQRHDKYGVILSGFNSVLPPLTFTSARLMEEIQVLVAGQAPRSSDVSAGLSNISKMAFGDSEVVDETDLSEGVEEGLTTSISLSSLDHAPASSPLNADSRSNLRFANAKKRPVLEYLEKGNTSSVYILDPFFAFYVKWHAPQALSEHAKLRNVAAVDSLEP